MAKIARSKNDAHYWEYKDIMDIVNNRVSDTLYCVLLWVDCDEGSRPLDCVYTTDGKEAKRLKEEYSHYGTWGWLEIDAPAELWTYIEQIGINKLEDMGSGVFDESKDVGLFLRWDGEDFEGVDPHIRELGEWSCAENPDIALMGDDLDARFVPATDFGFDSLYWVWHGRYFAATSAWIVNGFTWTDPDGIEHNIDI